MPIYEHSCVSADCRLRGRPVEHFYWREPESALCGECRGPAVRVLSTFAITFAGEITRRYNDPKKEYADQEGFTAYRRNTESGNAEPVFIDTWQKRKEFMRLEGLRDDVGAVEGSSDGKELRPTGGPGSWV